MLRRDDPDIFRNPGTVGCVVEFHATTLEIEPVLRQIR
jgi:hypothetical protein